MGIDVSVSACCLFDVSVSACCLFTPFRIQTAIRDREAKDATCFDSTAKQTRKFSTPRGGSARQRAQLNVHKQHLADKLKRRNLQRVSLHHAEEEDKKEAEMECAKRAEDARAAGAALLEEEARMIEAKKTKAAAKKNKKKNRPQAEQILQHAQANADKLVRLAQTFEREKDKDKARGIELVRKKKNEQEGEREKETAKGKAKLRERERVREREGQEGCRGEDQRHQEQEPAPQNVLLAHTALISLVPSVTSSPIKREEVLIDKLGGLHFSVRELSGVHEDEMPGGVFVAGRRGFTGVGCCKREGEEEREKDRKGGQDPRQTKCSCGICVECFAELEAYHVELWSVSYMQYSYACMNVSICVCFGTCVGAIECLFVCKSASMYLTPRSTECVQACVRLYVPNK